MTRLAFAAFWQVSLPASVIYINSGNKFPLINGEETFSIAAPSGTVMDGPTVKYPIPSSAGAKLNWTRKLPVGLANLAASWGNPAPSPGVGTFDANSPPLFISEWSDPQGTGNSVYEFIEITIVGGDGPAAPN